ncbi:MAG TPA: DinB family protein [Microlunatus sp.]|nr:DinB family protein [Microlunatus sp.]
MEPEPDTKDWTWVLTRRCEECGLAAAEIGIDEIAVRAELAAGEWVQILTASPAVNIRPAATVWSPLEYGAHVRDVFRLSDARLALMLVEDEPTLANWDQDETALTERYADSDPDEVADQLESAAEAFAHRLQGLEISQLDRRARRSDGAEFTVLTFAQYVLHDVIHHLYDVTGQQDAASVIAPDPAD